MILATDARVLNALANHPDILPFIAPEGTEALDFTTNYEDRQRPFIRFFHDGEESIGMLFVWSSPDVWEMHMLAKPEARGGMALRFARQTIEEMFFEQGARELWGQTPTWNKRAVVMHHKVGGIPRGTGINPIMGEVQYFATTKAEWRAHEDARSLNITTNPNENEVTT